MQNYKSKLSNIAVSALFTAIICVLAQISVLTPWGVPFTLQIFAVSLCGYILGVKQTLTSVLAYIFLGIMGVPVFSNFKGGIHTLFGISGGFILGFIALGVFCGIAKKLKKEYLKIILGICGVLICHLFGTVQLAIISKTNLLSAFITASLPFILKDLLLLIAAFYISKIINKRFKI